MMVTVMTHADQARIERTAILLELDHHVPAVVSRSPSTGKHVIQVPLDCARVGRELAQETWEKVAV